ncbi:MAG: TrkH family potassium uptake protein [Ruminococcaceae bacterium]|nr:TrkH family potassium uptake protein [Oscillospiraceae bacterium]
MNYRMIRYVLGWILIFEAIFLLLPALTAVIYREKELLHILITCGICAILGGLLVLFKPKNTLLFSREGFVIVSLSWITLSIFGALPLYLSGSVSSYVDALFETVSGFTTTGATILSDVEILPRSLLMWRSFTHWVGGMGVLVFIMAFLPLSGSYNMLIMKAESPGPSVSKLVPRVRTTALILYTLYFAFTILQFVLLLFGGMNVFEALNTAFATAGTGGFGVKNDSIGSYSPYIQVVVTVFMLLFSINFSSYYLILNKKFKDAFNTEVRWFLYIAFGAIAIITLNISHLFDSVWEAVRHAAFTVASIISTTGFMTVDFDLWPNLSRALIVMLMFIGACAGSTGGGIKVSRYMILIKDIIKEFRIMLHPKQIKKTIVDKRPVANEVIRSIYVYFGTFIIVFALSFLLICIENHDITTAFTAVAATINNVGPGLNLVGPTQNFIFFSDFSKIVLIFDMLAGRLELFPMLLLFNPATWRKK